MAHALSTVKGIGDKVAAALLKLSLHSKRDFLFNFPRSYEDRRSFPRIKQLKIGETQQFLGAIESVESKTVKNRLSVIECVITDGSGYVVGVWFNQPYLKKVLKPKLRVLIKGKVEKTLFDPMPKVSVLEFETFSSEKSLKEAIGKVVPIYTLTHGIQQHHMRKISDQLFGSTPYRIMDPTPVYIRDAHELVGLNTALREMHYPSDEAAFKAAQRRIIFDEFFYFQLRLGNKRLVHESENKTSPLIADGPLFAHFLSTLPYSLTADQEKSIAEIKHDVLQPVSMNRLLQGDVGAGKTDVAMAALLMALDAGFSGAIMAPTEILAEQHYQKFQHRLAALNIPIVLLKGKQRKAQRQAILDQLASGEPTLVIGTHALIQEPVVMPKLGLIVVDEQHRFGVVQRMSLRRKGICPHCLFMTATPIPRTFMLTSFGDLDKSIISTLPPGRVPPKTYFIKPPNFDRILDNCRQHLNQGEQLYVVYPLIEESEKLDLKSAMEGYEKLQKTFSDYKVGLIHGRLKGDEKTEIMNSFKDNDIQVLVSTTVIEVGIDVPNATQMIIQEAQRFGLSQLHQLRGRIGRGKAASTCYLVGDPRSDTGKKRIKSMVETTDGFLLAEYDLSIRGPGDMLGTRQAGMPSFHLADLIRDEAILLEARKAAFALLERDSGLNLPEHVGIKKLLENRPDMFAESLLN